MNRSEYFNYIEEKLSILVTRINLRGKLNILDLNIHAENFYLNFFNLLFDWELKNLNAIQQNAPGIDLIDDTNKIIVQVSATGTKQKIESALKKDLSKYHGYSFKFISISINSEELKTKTFINPHNLTFSPANDIFDTTNILNIILSLNTTKQKSIYDFLKIELKTEPDPEKIESNLTTIIKILSKEDLNHATSHYETVPYDIEEKILYNNIDAAKTLIEDYKIHYHRLDKIYSIFDNQGDNKSLSTLNAIRMEYLKLSQGTPADQCFFLVIDRISQKIRASYNYTNIPDEELELCVNILVVDAFIRCKIFKNPSVNA